MRYSQKSSILLAIFDYISLKKEDIAKNQYLTMTIQCSLFQYALFQCALFLMRVGKCRASSSARRAQPCITQGKRP